MYNPGLHTATNKPIGLTGKPLDARSYFYDANNFIYRAYVDSAEVLAYLIGGDRTGQFSIIINTGGTLVSGVITGGTNAEWWFKDGITDVDLILKSSSGGAAAWGSIGGNILNQTDLLAILAGTPIPITAGATPTPLSVAYAPLSNPLYKLRRADGTFDWNTNVVDTGTHLVIYGNDSGNGTFADDYDFTIKP